MRIVYLSSAEEDFRWMTTYYSYHFPEGGKKAWHRYQTSLNLITLHPALGRPYGKPPRRRFHVPNTSFVIYYQVIADSLEIVRIWDTRRNIEHLQV